MNSLGNSGTEKNAEDLLRLAGQIQMVVFDFDGVFTDNRVLVLQDGTEGVFCSRADGFGLEALKKLGVHLLVLSKEQNPVVSSRCKKLDLPCIQGCDNKAERLKKEAVGRGVSLAKLAYMGNDINDIECLRIAGLPACVSDSHPDVLAVSSFVTEASGGHGAVRELCDYIAKAQNGR
jgi:YrbI family 3-deoxy-D-manno-octulosonate 8-phosphate phosphatase